MRSLCGRSVGSRRSGLLLGSRRCGRARRDGRARRGAASGSLTRHCGCVCVWEVSRQECREEKNVVFIAEVWS